MDQTCCQRTQRPERCIDNTGSPSVQRRQPATLSRSGTTGPYGDNLCFFRCLVVHRGAPVKNVEVPTKTYYHQYLQYRQMASKDFHGVCLDDLMVLEQLFSLNVYVYDLQETEACDICMKTISATPAIRRSTATVSCVPSVTDCGNMLGCCTDTNEPVPEMSSTGILVACTIHDIPYSTD